MSEQNTPAVADADVAQIDAELTAAIGELRRKGNAGTAGLLCRAVESIRALRGHLTQWHRLSGADGVEMARLCRERDAARAAQRYAESIERQTALRCEELRAEREGMAAEVRAARDRPVETAAFRTIHEACDAAGIPTHHPDIGAPARAPMLPQERLGLMANELIGASHRLREVEDERDALAAVVGKLPKTADGVPIVRDMKIWQQFGDTGSGCEWTVAGVVLDEPSPKGWQFATLYGRPKGFARVEMSELFSSREAAKASRVAPPQ